jgi:methionyl-tRNA formyltransferase
MSGLKIIFMGTAELSCPSLSSLLRTLGISVNAVVTQPDRPKGRDLKLQPSPVKTLAVKYGLPVLQPLKARDPLFIQELAKLQPDLVVVAAYGQLLPPALLAIPKHGCINLHTSLLPKYRGAAPIQWALINGEQETGVTIMKMDAGLDTGDILAQEPVAIAPDDDSRTLHDRLARLGSELLVKTIPGYIAGRITPRPQPAEGVSYAPRISKQDGRIDWTQDGTHILNRMRGLTPWPGTFTYLPAEPKPVLLRIWRAQFEEAPHSPGQVAEAGKKGIVVGCGRGSLRVIELQREGGRRLRAADFLAGHPLNPGLRLG